MQPVIVFLSCLVLAGCGRQPTPDAPAGGAGAKATARLVDPARIDATLGGFVERGELVGVSALVFEDGEEAYYGAFGLADREAGRPVQRDTLVRIYSMTKPITGVVLMTLYEDGLFGLDDPLRDYLPEYSDVRVYVGGEGEEVRLESAARPITVRDILRHTAGFAAGDPNEPAWLLRRLQAVDPHNFGNSLEEMSRRLASVPLLFQPGTRWHYGPSVDVQARLAEVLAGRPYSQLLEERLFGPLKMADTGYALEPGQRERISALYERRPEGSFVRIADSESLAFNLGKKALTPGGWGLVSTIDDYMRFARMLQNGGVLDGTRILEEETIRLMATDAMPATVTDRSWLPNKGQMGFGIDFAVRVAPPASRAEASGAVGEFFWDGAANTLFWVDPQNDVTAVLFNIYRPWGRVEIQKDFRDAVYYRDEMATALNKPPAAAGAKRLSD